MRLTSRYPSNFLIWLTLVGKAILQNTGCQGRRGRNNRILAIAFHSRGANLCRDVRCSQPPRILRPRRRRGISPPHPYHGYTDSRSTSYSLRTLRFNYTIAFSHKSTSTNYIITTSHHRTPRAQLSAGPKHTTSLIPRREENGLMYSWLFSAC